MKKVLIFSLAYYPRYVSGAEAAIKEITDRVADIEFHMITLRFERGDALRERVGTIEVHRVGNSSYFGKMFFPFSAALAARRLHRTEYFNAAWAMMTYMLLPVVLARFLGVRVPYVLTLQDGDPYEKVFGRVRIIPFLPLIDWGFRHARIIQVISSYLGTWPAKRGYRGSVERIHNGANPRNLGGDIPPGEIEACKQKMGKKDGEIWLVNTARLEEQKGSDTTIRALARLPTRVRLALVGGGSQETKLRRLARECEVESRIYFAGQVDRAAAGAYRAASDIFVGPSRSEGLGNAFLSAMAARLPVIATQEGGLADFITEEVAWPVAKDNTDQIVRAVETILSDPKRAQEKVQKARAMMEQQYDWDMIAKQMHDRVFAKVV